MRQRTSRPAAAASLAVALAVGAALAGGPAQAGGDVKLNVSATILPRIACSIAGGTAELAGARGAAASIRATPRCQGTGAATNYRVRRDGAGAQAASGIHADAVVLTIEL